MKRILLIILVASLATTTQAQHKVKEKEVIGTWKLIIDVEDALKDAEEEASEESLLGKVILSSVSGLVSGILEEIEIYMDFRPDGELKIAVEAFGEREIEYSEWSIKNGRLYIKDTDHFDMDVDDYWLMDDGMLVAYEDDGEPNANVYMVSIDQ
ncbi:hypothetical protein [Marinoscillum furvescens]|uniref:Lipocalin-like protein n=1 Tax=Marinoscillum furvescens DSM 4134 TaxID=1122208 RepID=A0A3D9L3K7_MARFU|nr:hypothetical protein [Marinoscillum furvescens]RED97951.1 hypothetical protein C7460_11192 [Marinoscillum furvescens DSM 4134]